MPGLRREELASLAGVSISYYTRLERGEAAGVSDSVLGAIAGALRLDEAERTHLAELVRALGHGRPLQRRPVPTHLRPGLEQVLEVITGAPAIIYNRQLDILGANTLGRALYETFYDFDGERPNMARFAFLAPGAERFYASWGQSAEEIVSILRAAAAHDPYDRALAALVGELSMGSNEFRVRWARHNVRAHQTGEVTYLHPVVGEVHVAFESFEIGSDPGLALKIYRAEPASPSADALSLLASWASTARGQLGDTSSRGSTPATERKQ